MIGFLIVPQAGFIVYGFSWVPALAFAGSLSTVLLVYFLARSDGRVAVTTLLLAGVAVGAFLTASMSFLMLTQSDSQFRLGAIFSWLLGGVGTVGWDQFLLLGPFVATGLLVARALAQPLNALALGEEHAHALGVRVEQTKLNPDRRLVADDGGGRRGGRAGRVRGAGDAARRCDCSSAPTSGACCGRRRCTGRCSSCWPTSWRGRCSRPPRCRWA